MDNVYVCTGLSQLPLIMALVKIQGSDVELCNAEGVTPLMLAAAAGNTVLCDVSAQLGVCVGGGEFSVM